MFTVSHGYPASVKLLTRPPGYCNCSDKVQLMENEATLKEGLGLACWPYSMLSCVACADYVDEYKYGFFFGGFSPVCDQNSSYVCFDHENTQMVFVQHCTNESKDTRQGRVWQRKSIHHTA